MAITPVQRSLKELETKRGAKKLTAEGKQCYSSWKMFKCHYDVREKISDAVAGRLDYIRPEPPKDPRTIHGFGLPYEEQKFPYHEKSKVAQMEDWMDEEHINFNKYAEFIDAEWDIIENGFWFFNNGNLEYLTGYNYIFLQYWLLKVTVMVDGMEKKITTNPSFRDMHRDVFYAYESVKYDKKSYGILFYSYRRAGKTALALFIGFMETIMYRDQAMTMQSKNEKDGRSVFKKVVQSWKTFPKFLKPNDAGDTDPQKELKFYEGKKKADVKDREYSHAFINSYISYMASSDAALDGLYFSFIFQDEVGKVLTGIDVNERWNISKECLSDGTTIIGKAIVTSTIEDMEKYASHLAKRLWERSDTENPDPILDRTDSGLYQLFFPAYYGLQGTDEGDSFVDEWGYTDTARAYSYIMAMYEYKKGEDLLSFRRKYPISINDVFALADGSNNFSKENIYQQKKYNSEMPISPVQRGNFMWKNGVIDSEVVFYPDKEGRWEVSWQPPKGDRNRYQTRSNQKSPTRFFARTGCDPFDQSFTRGSGSKAAAVTTVRNHATSPEVHNGIVCVYLHRQKYAEDFFEDMIKQSLFYSSPFLAESNKSGVLEHFRKRGYNGFAMKDPLEKNEKKKAGEIRGIPMTGEFKRNALIDAIQSFIYDSIGLNEQTDTYGWCPHYEVLDEWLRFDSSKWTVYDLTVAGGMSLLAWLEAPKKTKVKKDISNYFQVFK